MLVRYPGLSLIGGIAIAFAIAVGAGLFEFINLTLPGPRLPLPHGERVVGLRYWDLESNTPAPLDAATLHEWQKSLTTIDHVGGYRTAMRNLRAGDRDFGPAETAIISPSGFAAAGVSAALGRVLEDSDAQPGAVPVAVVSHEIWQSFLQRAPDTVGRIVRLGAADVTIVGVMPPGFGFPLHHSVWTPLMVDPNAGVLQGVRAFGRLHVGATLAQAQAEADALTPHILRPRPTSGHRLAAHVLSYRASLFERPVSLLMRAILLQVNLFAVLFVLLVSANVALLMFARAAAREREFVVRTALGASRRRVVAQLFIEALALSVLATACGLAVVKPALTMISAEITAMGGGSAPFWFLPQVSLDTALYAAALAVAAAAMIGVVPALKATGRDVTSRLGQATAGAGGIRFGGIWTAIVVMQISATVIFSAGAALMVRQAWRTATIRAPFAADAYLTMRVELDPDVNAGESYASALRRFERRLADDPAVVSVTLGDGLPLTTRPEVLLDVQSRNGGDAVSAARSGVDDKFFRTFDARLIAGRFLEERDFGVAANAVVVDKYFVESVLGGRNAVGERVRVYDSSGRPADGAWLEIIGVVDNLEVRQATRSFLDEPSRGMLYYPVRVDDSRAGSQAAIVRMRSEGEALHARLHRIAADVNPALRVLDIKTLAQVANAEVAFWRLWADLVLAVSLVALFLSLAGIYAATSFAVARRTREIGVRVALGATPTRIAASVLARPFRHVTAGVVLGSLLMTLFFALTNNALGLSEGIAMLTLGVAIVISCTLACVVPMRRALRVQPSEALGAEL